MKSNHVINKTTLSQRCSIVYKKENEKRDKRELQHRKWHMHFIEGLHINYFQILLKVLWSLQQAMETETAESLIDNWL